MTINTLLLFLVIVGGLVGFLGHALMLARNPSGTIGGLAPNWESAPVSSETAQL